MAYKALTDAEVKRIEEACIALHAAKMSIEEFAQAIGTISGTETAKAKRRLRHALRKIANFKHLVN